MTETERELQDLQKHVAALAKTLSKSNKLLLENAKSTKAFKNLQKLSTKTMGQWWKRVKKGDGLFHEFNDALKAGQKDLKGFSKVLKGMPSPMGLVVKGLKFLKDATIGVGIAMAKTALALSDVTTRISGVEDLVQLGIDEIPILGRVLAEVGKEIDANVETFTQLSKVGASFGSSIINLRAAQFEALMPLEKFTDMIGSNSTMLAKLFGSVSEGVPQISRLTRELRDITERDFAKFGLTLDDTSEYMMTYLELERARGNTERMSRSQLLKGTADYTKNLVVLSKLTGKSVDELNEANMAHAADGVMQSQLSKMSAKDAKVLTTNINALPGPMRQFAKEMLFLGAPISEVSRELEAMSGGKYGEAFARFKEDLDPIAFQNAIKTIGDEVMDSAGAFGKASLAGGGFGEALNVVAETLGKAIDPAKIEDEIQARGDNIASLRNLTSEIDVTVAEFQNARLQLGRALLYDQDSVVDVGSKLSEHLREMNDGALKKFGKTMTKFGDWLAGKEIKEDKKEVKGSRYGNWGNMSYGQQMPDEFLDPADYNKGTDGFRNFGDGTPAMLHGVEAVVPKNDIGQIHELLKATGATLIAKNQMENLFGSAVTLLEKHKKPDDTGANVTTTNNIMASDTQKIAEIIQLTTVSSNILKSQLKIESHLNKLVAINMATERNTKGTNKAVADMSGTLV